MRFRQIVASALTVACLCTCFTTTVSAKTVSTFSLVNGVSPLYDIAKSAYSKLYIVGTSAECKSQADGVDTVKITIVQTLQKYSGWFWIWDDVDGASWTRTENRSSVNLSNTKIGLTSGTYRVKSVFTLTDKNGKTETLTIYSNEVSVN